MDDQKFFIDREDAGVKLSKKLAEKREKFSHVIALPRGGVIVASEIAKKFHTPIDVLVVRKIGRLQNPEFGIGAISEKNNLIWDLGSMKKYGITKKEMHPTLLKEQLELQRRMKIYRGEKSPQKVFGKNIILVDDGAATGVTALAAIKTVQSYKPADIVLAVPVCSLYAKRLIEKEGVKVISFLFPEPFHSIGSFYQNFKQVTDREVLLVLNNSNYLPVGED